MQNLHHYMDDFSSLHTAKVKGYKAPHKAVLLLSIIDLIEEGSIASPHIRLTDALEKKFHEVWHRYLGIPFENLRVNLAHQPGSSAVFAPDIAKPYFLMQHESHRIRFICFICGPVSGRTEKSTIRPIRCSTSLRSSRKTTIRPIRSIRGHPHPRRSYNSFN